MKTCHVLLGALLLAGPTNCSAEDVLDAKTINLVIREAETRGEALDVEVIGLGESSAAVDHVSISIFVEIVDKENQVKPKLQSDLDVKRLIKTAKDHGVDMSDIDGTHVSTPSLARSLVPYGKRRFHTHAAGHYASMRKVSARLAQLQTALLAITPDEQRFSRWLDHMHKTVLRPTSNRSSQEPTARAT